MRIPLSDTDVGYFWTHKYDKSATFVGDFGTWSAEYSKKHGFRMGSFAEFKELYPYDNGNGRSRSKVKTKYNGIYNKTTGS